MSKNDPPGARRPLLSKGERLRTKATKVRRGGDKFHPVGVDEAFATLGPQAIELLRGVLDMPAEKSGPHVVFEATLRPNYLASTYFPAKLLEQSGLYFAGARATRATKVTKTTSSDDALTKTLILAGKSVDVAKFAAMVATPPTGTTQPQWDEIRRFQELVLPSCKRVIVRRPELGAGEIITWEAVLTHVFDSPQRERAWADQVFAKWVLFIRSLGGDVNESFRRDVDHLTFVPINLSGEALDEAANFNLLRAIRPMPQVRPFPESVLRLTAPSTLLPSKAAEEGRVPEITVAAFDGGVDATSHLFAPFVEAVDLTSEPAIAKGLRHGSLVTSALLYGPLAAETTQLPDPVVRVVHHRIFPVPPTATGAFDAGVYWMLDQIGERVRTGAFRRVSLSVGPDESVDDDLEPSRWTTELDALAKEREVTFVTAAGNNGKLDEQLGFNRVQAPGDMVNGICVGACADRDPDKINRAEYSAVGPGREGQRVQPTGVAFGGSDAEPFIGIAGGHLVQACGTSFAAPVAARGIGGLHGRLDDDRQRPEISRVFATHFAKKMPKRHAVLEVGHGRLLEDYGSAFECTPNEATVLYEDVLLRAQSTGFAIPIPTGLPPATQLTLRWTLTFLTAVDARDPADYTRSGIEVTFRPNSLLREVTYPDGTKATLHVVRDGAEIARVLEEGGTESEQGPAGQQWRAYRSEAARRIEGKWETICCGKKRLPASALEVPRLDLVHLHRTGGQLISEGVPDLRIAMLVTVSAAKGVAIYDRVASEFRVLVPLIQLPIRVSSVA
jgi:hypothetical protein